MGSVEKAHWPGWVLSLMADHSVKRDGDTVEVYCPRINYASQAFLPDEPEQYQIEAALYRAWRRLARHIWENHGPDGRRIDISAMCSRCQHAEGVHGTDEAGNERCSPKGAMRDGGMVWRCRCQGFRL